MPLIQPHQLRWIERNLIDNDILFVVIGGVAVKFYCPSRETKDVDIFIGHDPIMIDRLVARIPKLAQNLENKAKLLNPKIGNFNVDGEYKIDVLTFAPGIDFKEAINTAECYRLDGVDIPILSVSLLIALKKEIGEPKDLDDVRLLKQIGKA